MLSLRLRGLSQQTYPGKLDLASRNHRSMGEQVRVLIEREMGLGQPDSFERAKN
jgi:hypothetical protein